MVIEDVAVLRDALIAALEAEGWQVVIASDEAAALAVLASRDVDLVVADTSEGPAALARFEDAYPELPLIILSDGGGVAGVFFGPWHRSGSRRTLRQPYTLTDLIAAARDALGETATS